MFETIKKIGKGVIKMASDATAAGFNYLTKKAEISHEIFKEVKSDVKEALSKKSTRKVVAFSGMMLSLAFFGISTMVFVGTL